MPTFTHPAKTHVWHYWQTQLGVPLEELADEMSVYVAPTIHFKGPYPAKHLNGVDAIAEALWLPLRSAFPDMERDTTIFFARDLAEGVTWVAGMGHLRGTFDAALLGIPPTKAAAHLRFGEFCKVENGLITENHLLLDFLDLMHQAGFNVLPPNRGAVDLFPAPMMGNGIQETNGDLAETEQSEQLVRAMLFGGLNTFDGSDLNSMGIERYWHTNMRWYGPHGIGGCIDMKEFQDFHQEPFLTAFPDRQATAHEAIVGEGQYVGASGWPGVIGTHGEGYLGQHATKRTIHMDLMDFWYRDGDRLLENWVLIDIIDIFRQFGVDLLGRLNDQVQRLS